MLPDDVFRARLQSTITALRYWAPSIADSARLAEAETGDYWRLAVMPKVASACAFNVTLYNDQNYDLTIGGEVYGGRPLQSFDWFVPFAEAVADGNVMQRRWISRLTGMERAVETLVMLSGGGIWREGRGGTQYRPTLEDDGSELRERRFLPYRR
jgi:hypothetical protein